MNNDLELIYDVHERPNKKIWALLSLQHVFAMFGATVLVPLLTGLPVSVSLVASGVGTLIYIACTKGRVPVYLGSSFAYITTMTMLAASTGSMSAAYCGLILVGLIYVAVSFAIRFFGSDWLRKLLPSIIVGPMIIVIGLSLAPTAIDMIGLNQETIDWRYLTVAIITFVTTASIGIRAKGYLKIIPFLVGLIVGYISACMLGLVDFAPVMAAPWVEVPEFVWFGTYEPDWYAALAIIPVAFVTIAEHIGDHTVLGRITNKDYLESPGLENTLLGDGLATIASAVMGGPANTTYGENTGVIAMNKVASVWVIGGAAIIAIMLGFCGKVTAFISTIPDPVMGGISLILFGLIASNGVKVLIEDKVDLNSTRNIIIVATMLVIGLGGAALPISEMVSLSGMALAALIGISLNLLLPKEI